MKDLKIRTQLLAGNILITCLFIAISFLTFRQSEVIYKNMKDLYDHPYHVGRATRDIMTNCAMIHSYMKNIVFEADLTMEELLEIDLKIEALEKQTYESFQVVYDRYLGHKFEIDSAYKVFSDWKILRDRLIHMRQHNSGIELINRYNEVNQPYVDKVMTTVGVMVNFEGSKSQEFYISAQKESRKLMIRMLIFNLILIVAIILIYYLIARAIYDPLKGLTQAAERYRSGNYLTDFLYQSRNEFGVLSLAFQKMASTFRKEITLKENTAEIAFSLHDNNLRSFIKSLLSKLISITDCQVAAFYLLNREEEIFRHYYSIGMDTENYRSFSANMPEGEFGMLISEKKIRVIRNIPDDTSFSFITVTGTFRPREIVSIPILNIDGIIALISLSSIRGFDPIVIQWLNDIWPMLTARINGVLASQRIRDYSEIVDKQNLELDRKNKELYRQTEELREFNTELSVQKKQLDQLNYLKTSFLSNMSHELRTPLNSVIALASVLSRKLKGRISDEEYNYVTIIEKNGKELLDLINDVLDLSRIEAGREILSISPFSAKELVDNIIDNLKPQIRDKDLVIENKISFELPVVSDKLKCSHILQNIIHNAIKFTEKGFVKIESIVQNDQIRFSIEDTGVGIAPEKLEMIFDEFRQADERTSRKFGGSGLGLAIARKYCNMLGGSIEVTSKPGSGSVFTVLLPLNPPYASGYTGEVSVNGTDLKGDIISEGKTVMIIEDSEAAIIQLSDILQQEGFQIIVARDGSMAFELLKELVPDAIILDLMMPTIDGFEVLKTLRAMEITMNVPVLILTAKHVTAEELSILKRNKVSQLIQKGSIRKDELLRTIRNMLSGKRSSETL